MANSTLETSFESFTAIPDANASANIQTQQLPDKRLLESVRLHYHSDHQAQYLQLQAQIDSLLVQLQEANH